VIGVVQVIENPDSRFLKASGRVGRRVNGQSFCFFIGNTAGSGILAPALLGRFHGSGRRRRGVLAAAEKEENDRQVR
jgi:hypothetical protein